MFNKKYYLIPIFDKCVFIKDSDQDHIPLYWYTKKYFSTLTKLEEERVGIIYSGNCNNPLTYLQKSKISMVQAKQKQKSDEIGIPLFILAVGNNKKVYEIITKEPILSNTSASLSIREVSRSEFEKEYNSMYDSKIQKFINRRNFRLIKSEGQKVLRKD